MVPTPERPLRRVPHNPGVRNLVLAKRRWSSAPLKEMAQQGFRGWHERGYLPHRDEPGLTQFVTFHLADSFPTALRSEWEHLWRIEDDRKRRTQLERYLDTGRGDCVLRKPEVARLVEEDFLNHAHGRYELRAWVIMPNHVHVLFRVFSMPMSRIVGDWKKHTARMINRELGRRGKVWAEDYFDVFMRNADHERRTVLYIENNPSKARLVRDSQDWPWGSARLRDALGRLQTAAP